MDPIDFVWLFVSALLGIWAFGLVIAALFVDDNRRQRYTFLTMAIVVYYISLVLLKGA